MAPSLPSCLPAQPHVEDGEVGSRVSELGAGVADRCCHADHLEVLPRAYHFFLARADASSLVWTADEVPEAGVFGFNRLGFLGSRLLRF